MPAAIKPENEEQRLKDLTNYKILDTLPEQEYNNITKLTSIICNVPIALVSLVDRDRQWFKAKTGLGANETHRNLAFCAHAVLDPEGPLIVENAAENRMFSDNALVTGDPNIRFYAGYPLNTSSGHCLGTLCAIDRKPRSLTQEQSEILKYLSNYVVILLELRKQANTPNISSQFGQFALIASQNIGETIVLIKKYEASSRSHLDDAAKQCIQMFLDSASKTQEVLKLLIKKGDQ